MRKCPNCKKPVSVGARRCVHCRALLTDLNEPDKSSREQKYDDRADEYSPTKKGIGAMSMSEVRRRWDEPLDDTGGQGTISGMPGISFDLKGGAHASSAVLNASRLKEPEPESEPKIDSNEIMDLDDLDKMVNDLASASFSSPSGVMDVFTPPSTPQQSSVLAGLPGVVTSSSAPMPSSLLDEELDDLTSKLFGDDYAAGSLDDDEEDGWDFDIPSIPLSPQHAAKISETPSVPSYSDLPITVEEPVSSEELATDRKVGQVSVDEEAKTETIGEEAKTETTDGEVKAETKDPSGMDLFEVDVDLEEEVPPSRNILPRIFALLAALAACTWIGFVVYTGNLKMSGAIPLISVSGFVALLDLFFFGLHRKLKPVLWGVFLFVPAIAIIVLMYLTDMGTFWPEILIGSMVCQFVCAAVMFLKKN